MEGDPEIVSIAVSTFISDVDEDQNIRVTDNSRNAVTRYFTLHGDLNSFYALKHVGDNTVDLPRKMSAAIILAVIKDIQANPARYGLF